MSEKDDDLSNLTSKERFEQNKNKIANSHTQQSYIKNPHFKSVLNQNIKPNILNKSSDILNKETTISKPAPPQKPPKPPSHINTIKQILDSTTQPPSLPIKPIKVEHNSNKEAAEMSNIDRSSSFNKKYFDWTKVIPSYSLFFQLPSELEKGQSEFKKIDLTNLSLDPNKPPEALKLNQSDIEKLSMYLK